MADNQNLNPEENYVKMPQREDGELLQPRKEREDGTNILTPIPNIKPQFSRLESLRVGINEAEPSIGWDFGLQGGSNNQETSTDGDIIDGNAADNTNDLSGKSVSYVWNSEVNLGKVTNTPNALKNFLFDALCDILRSQELRHALCNLQGNSAQVIIDYLYTVLLQPKLPETWLRRHCLVALYKLSKSSLLYPQCYNLKETIAFSSTHVGGGGYSDIYKGKLGQTELCLKVVRLPSENDASYVLKIYAKEAILWGQLRHPNIAPFYGLFYRDKIRRELCLVSPWMCHGDLGEYLRTHSSPDRISLSYDVVSGLGYLHRLGLIHSDLKAANVLVNDLERALITDFGMSFIRTDKTLADVIISKEIHGCTTRWSAPELFEEEAHATMASDIWALGCVLYQIMTGKSPFADLLTDAQIIKAVISGKKPGASVCTLDPADKVIWEEVVRCFETNPEERPNCHDVMRRFQSAGMSWGGEHAALTDALRKRQDFLQAMHVDLEKSLDIEEVGRIFENLKTDIEQVLGDFLLEELLDILRIKKLRQRLKKLQDAQAQVVVDYLSSVLLGPELTETELRARCFSCLRDLSRAPNLQPPFYSLKKSITPGAVISAGRNANMHKVTVEGKDLRLVVTHQLTPELKESFKRAEVVNQPLNHPNVAPLYGIYSIPEQEHLCLVGPWMSHGNIVQYLRSFPDISCAPFVHDIASGLEYLHDQGIFHEYLIGASILVNDSQRACVSPIWFLSLTEESDILASNGPLCYEAPEVVLSDSEASAATEIWTFGCICYEILTGNRPFHHIGATGRHLARRIREEHNTGHRPGEIPNTFSDPIEKAIWMEVDRCWSRNPSNRPTARDIRLSLESAGLSRENKGFNEDVVKRERQRIRGQLGDSDPVDLKAVQRVFEELRQSK